LGAGQSPSGVSRYDAPRQGNAISINGGRPTSNNYTLDGLVNTDTALNTPASFCRKMRSKSSRNRAEAIPPHTDSAPNQVNIVSKSGTNSLHGTVFETVRNDAFDAKVTFRTNSRAAPESVRLCCRRSRVFRKLYDGRKDFLARELRRLENPERILRERKHSGSCTN